jgi:hypothetical protein
MVGAVLYFKGTLMEMNETSPSFVLPLHWKAVVLCDGSRFDWHKKGARAARDREQLEVACVYRWVFRAANSRPEQFYLYIGQSGKFEERLPSYRSTNPAAGSTEELLRREMSRCEEQGGKVDLEFLDLGNPLRINGKLINKYSLGERDVRVMMENISIVTAKADGIKLINRLGDNTNEVKILNLAKKIVGQKGFPEASRLLKGLLDPDTRSIERK